MMTETHRRGRALAFPALVLAFVLGCNRVCAESPEIARQHANYLAAKQIWEEKRLPRNLANAPKAEDATPRASGMARTTLLLNDVDFHITSGIGFSIGRLVISMEPKSPGAPINFDHVENFIIRLQQGGVTIHADALNALFNKHVLAYKGAPMRKMKLKTLESELGADANLVLTEALGGIAVPTSLSGSVRLSHENKIVYDVKRISALGVPVRSVMEALGLTLPKVANIRRPGVTMRDFSIEMNHRKMFPLPELDGNISSVSLHADGLHLTFGDAPKAELDPPDFLKGSYIWVQAGDPKFFGSIVLNARIAMLPADQKKRLRFDLYGYRKQLAAGEATLSEDGLLIVRVP